MYSRLADHDSQERPPWLSGANSLTMIIVPYAGKPGGRQRQREKDTGTEADSSWRPCLGCDTLEDIDVHPSAEGRRCDE